MAAEAAGAPPWWGTAVIGLAGALIGSASSAGVALLLDRKKSRREREDAWTARRVEVAGRYFAAIQPFLMMVGLPKNNEDLHKWTTEFLILANQLALMLTGEPREKVFAVADAIADLGGHLWKREGETWTGVHSEMRDAIARRHLDLRDTLSEVLRVT